MIRRSLTEKSDLLSHIVDHGDWTINEHFSISWNVYGGPYSTDKFDDHLNYKLPKIMGSRF